MQISLTMFPLSIASWFSEYIRSNDSVEGGKKANGSYSANGRAKSNIFDAKGNLDDETEFDDL